MLTLMQVLLSIILVLAVIYAGALAFGAWHWDRATQTLVARLRAARQPAQPRFVHLRTIEGTAAARTALLPRPCCATASR